MRRAAPRPTRTLRGLFVATVLSLLTILVPLGTPDADAGGVFELDLIINKQFFGTSPTASVPITFDVVGSDPGCTMTSIILPAGSTSVTSRVLGFGDQQVCDYTVTELPVEGWTIVDDTQFAEFTEGDYIFTFQNVQDSTITIDKTVIGQPPSADWSFRVTSSALADPRCALDTTVTVPAVGGSTSVDVADLGQFGSCTYDVAETAQAGYTPSPDPAVYTDLVPGSTAAFTNTADPGSITIIKRLAPDSAQTFDFTGDLGTFSLGDDGSQTFSTLAAGNYTITETAVAGFITSVSCDDGTTSSTGTVSVALPVAGNITCEFTNTAQFGSITIVKRLSPDSAQTFDFSGDLGTFSLGDDQSQTFAGLLPGSYTITETAVAGFATSVSCDDGTTTTSASVTVTLPAMGDLICEFSNVEQPGSVTVIKRLVPDSSDTFDFVGDLGAFSLGDDESQTFAGLTPGIYAIEESVVSGYTTSVSCDDGSTGTTSVSVTVPAGVDVVCEFTNTAQPGSITIILDSDPADGTDFAFTTTGLDPATFSLDDDTDPTLEDRIVFTDAGLADGVAAGGISNLVSPSLAAGSYGVVQAAAAGWTTTVSCDDPTGDSTVNGLAIGIELAIGESVVCTFVNVLQPVPTPTPTPTPTPEPEATATPTPTPEPTPEPTPTARIVRRDDPTVPLPTLTPTPEPTEVVAVAVPAQPAEQVGGLAVTGPAEDSSQLALVLVGLGAFAIAVSRAGRRQD